jgi:hypothetical protein
MNFYVFNYQHKGQPYFTALRSQGHKPVARIADVALYDRDRYIQSPDHTISKVQQQIDRGSKIVIYPHSALPPWWYDGLIKLQDYIAGLIVIGEGQRDAVKVFEPDAPVIVGGWPWCPQKPFRKPDKLRTILFGPTHTSGGKIRRTAFNANKAIFNELKQVKRETGCRVVVRYLGDLKRQGLHPYREFEWIRGQADGSTKELDEADVVIAEQTYMYFSVARGAPTIGMIQHLPMSANSHPEKYTPKNWDKYGPDIAYPINYGTKPLIELIEDAMSGEQTEWRRRLIGKDLNPAKFSRQMMELTR